MSGEMIVRQDPPPVAGLFEQRIRRFETVARNRPRGIIGVRADPDDPVEAWIPLDMPHVEPFHQQPFGINVIRVPLPVAFIRIGHQGHDIHGRRARR